MENFSNLDEKEIGKAYITIGKNVKFLREERSLSQMELAHSIGIKSIAFFSNAENYRYDKHFNIEHLLKMAKALNVEVCEFFKES